MAETKEPVYNSKWTFSMQVRVGELRIRHPEVGQVDVYKVSIIDTGSKCKIECSGRLVGSIPVQQAMRTAVYSINGYSPHPPPPQMVLDFVRKYAFPRTEI